MIKKLLLHKKPIVFIWLLSVPLVLLFATLLTITHFLLLHIYFFSIQFVGYVFPVTCLFCSIQCWRICFELNQRRPECLQSQEIPSDFNQGNVTSFVISCCVMLCFTLPRSLLIFYNLSSPVLFYLIFVRFALNYFCCNLMICSITAFIRTISVTSVIIAWILCERYIFHILIISAEASWWNIISFKNAHNAWFLFHEYCWRLGEIFLLV